MVYYSTRPYRMVTAKNRALPDFLIIGTQKGGTNYLGYLQKQHPQIHMARGEVHYFDREPNYKKGELWYRSHFPLQGEINQSEIVGEATPGYLFSPKAAKRIKEDLSNAKLICLLRNPTERAISHYFMSIRHKNERRPIVEAILDDKSQYKQRGLYLEQIKRYEKYLKENRLLILSSEELFANPKKILKQVFKFLGVDETSERPDIRPRNVGKNKTTVPPEVYEHLNKYFQPHNRRLYNYLNRDFGW